MTQPKRTNWVPPMWLTVLCTASFLAGLVVVWLVTAGGRGAYKGRPVAVLCIVFVVVPLGVVIQACLAYTRNGYFRGSDIAATVVAASGAVLVASSLGEDAPPVYAGLGLLGCALLYVLNRIAAHFLDDTPVKEISDVESIQEGPVGIGVWEARGVQVLPQQGGYRQPIGVCPL